MNVIERAECLLDAGSSGNMNFTVIAAYQGSLAPAALEQALKALQDQHLLLRSALVWEGHHCRFSPTSRPVPLQVQPLAEPERQAWKPATMAALRQDFEGGDEPLWRLTWLRGADAGQLLITFHHAIADGLSAMALVEQLFQHLGALMAGTGSLRPAPSWDDQAPDLASSFALEQHPPFAVRTLAERQDVGLSTGYVLEELSAQSSLALLAWSRERGLRLNAILLAAFLQALVEAGILPSDTTAHTVVNLRQLAQPTLSWDLMRLLRVCVDTPIRVDPTAPLADLARELHGDLQQQLRAGMPIRSLHTIAAAIEDSPSPRQLWRRSWRQGGLITNLGQVPVQGAHGPLQLERLFFVANIEPIALPDQPLAVLGAMSFRDRLMLTYFHIEQQVDEAQATAVLAELKRRLLAVTAGHDRLP